MSAKQQPGALQEKLNLYLTVLVLFLLIALPPVLCGLFYLSRAPDIVWEGDDQLTFDRIWMYRTRRPAGIGYQSQRVIDEYSAAEVCVQNKVRFFLWAKAEEATETTTRQLMVYDNQRWQPTGRPCPQ